jgi:glycosyltransferase involved in cell wall biosynthesis
MPRFLLVVPAYRESARLPQFLESLGAAVGDHLPGSSVLVVDDGSGELEQSRTASLIENLRRDHPAILSPLLLPGNVGKGGAILAGWDTGSDYDFLGFVDADGAVPVREVIRLVGMTGASASPALFASRVKMLGRSIRRSTMRHYTGRLFASIVGLLINPNVYDSQCGLKILPRAAYERIRPFLLGRRFAFDVELLATLGRIGHPICEIPIDWEDIPGSKVSLLRDTLRMARAVLEIRRDFKRETKAPSKPDQKHPHPGKGVY